MSMDKEVPFETDGPARAFFEVADGSRDAEGNLYVMRFTYHTLKFGSFEEFEAAKALEAALDEVRRLIPTGIIFYRIRPEYESDYSSEHKRVLHTARVRIATSPPLGNEVWACLGRLYGEGAAPKMVP